MEIKILDLCQQLLLCIQFLKMEMILGQTYFSRYLISFFISKAYVRKIKGLESKTLGSHHKYTIEEPLKGTQENVGFICFSQLESATNNRDYGSKKLVISQ